MDQGVVDFLRDKAAEENLDEILKTSMGGYTKKSVQEYVSQLRKQQLAASRRFEDDMKGLLAEKESLKEEIKRLEVNYNKREAQYRTLADRFEEFQKTETYESAENLIELKRRLAGQEDQTAALEAEKLMLEQKLEQLKTQTEEVNDELEQKVQELRLVKDMLREEKGKHTLSLKQLREVTSEHAAAQEELAFLREQISDGAVGKLKKRITALQADVKSQEELLKERLEEIQAKEQQIQANVLQNEMSQKQVKMLEQKMEQVQQTADLVTEQNLQLEAYQKELTEKLQEMFQNNLDMLHKQSLLNLENMRLSRKLDELSRGIVSAEEIKE